MIAIDVVIIGLNSAGSLERCLASVRASFPPNAQINVIYADGGSSDGSRELAEQLGAKVLLVNDGDPTPGKQRNRGWRSGTAPLIQFIDSDTELDTRWLAEASSRFSEGIGAVCGDRREKLPKASVYNWIGDLEWNALPGPVEEFGGDVMIRRDVLELTGGYRDDLIAGEDPELSHRIGLAGFQILKLNQLMTLHDLGMRSFRQYWKRNFRSGHAFAEVNRIHTGFWKLSFRRIQVRGLAFFILPIALASGIIWWPMWLVALAVGTVAFRPLLLLRGQFRQRWNLTGPQSWVYGLHASLVVVPQFVGVLRFSLGKIFSQPLTNRRLKNNPPTSEIHKK